MQRIHLKAFNMKMCYRTFSSKHLALVKVPVLELYLFLIGFLI